jgi:TrmH family RNA methyltransferase
MLSKSKARFIISLQKKKIRDELKLFIVEGDKLVKEFLNSGMPVMTLIAKPEFINGLPEEITSGVREIEPVSFEELKRISTLKTPHNALAVVSIAERKFNPEIVTKKICVALDFIQDPGNLGTIIRAAAWFGIKNIVCSEDCVDIYNPKVVQATMGAILNVNVYYHDLSDLLNLASKKGVPIFGSMLEGESIYSQKLGNKGIILLGNESKGISEELIPFITDRITIPRFNKTGTGIDSLNVGMAASVVFSEFARRR